MDLRELSRYAQIGDSPIGLDPEYSYHHIQMPMSDDFDEYICCPNQILRLRPQLPRCSEFDQLLRL